MQFFGQKMFKQLIYLFLPSHGVVDLVTHRLLNKKKIKHAQFNSLLKKPRHFLVEAEIKVKLAFT